MNTQRDLGREGGAGEGKKERGGGEGPRGFMAPFSTADSAWAPHASLPAQVSSPSPVVDLQNGEPRVLRQLFLLVLRGVWVLWPPARVTLPAGLPSDSQSLAHPSPRGWRAQTGAGAGRATSSELLRAPPGAQQREASQALSNYACACRRPRLFQQIEANWPALIRGRQSLGTGLHCCERS